MKKLIIGMIALSALLISNFAQAKYPYSSKAFAFCVKLERASIKNGRLCVKQAERVEKTGKEFIKDMTNEVALKNWMSAKNALGLCGGKFVNVCGHLYPKK